MLEITREKVKRRKDSVEMIGPFAFSCEIWTSGASCRKNQIHHMGGINPNCGEAEKITPRLAKLLDSFEKELRCSHRAFDSGFLAQQSNFLPRISRPEPFWVFIRVGQELSVTEGAELASLKSSTRRCISTRIIKI